MSKLSIAMKLLKNPYARRIATSPHTRSLVVKALKNEKVRKTLIKQVSKRLVSR